MNKILTVCLALSLLACNGGENASQLPVLEKLHGQWVVINYWAQWCHPCVAEIPELNALDQQYSEVTVLGVNYDGASGQELQRQQERLGVEFMTLESDPAVQLGIPRPVVLPTTIILKPDGDLFTALTGPQTLESLAQIMDQASSESLD